MTRVAYVHKMLLQFQNFIVVLNELKGGLCVCTLELKRLQSIRKISLSTVNSLMTCSFSDKRSNLDIPTWTLDVLD